MIYSLFESVELYRSMRQRLWMDLLESSLGRLGVQCYEAFSDQGAVFGEKGSNVDQSDRSFFSFETFSLILSIFVEL